MSSKFLLRSFAGGEIATELYGRLDITKYQTGLSLCRNFIVLPHGPITRRPGFEFINEARDSTEAVRVIPFSFSVTQTAVLEFGDGYIRFHINGGTLLEDAVAIASIVGADVTTTPPHGYTTGDSVFIGSRFHLVTVTGANTFQTSDGWGDPTDSVGTTAARVYTIASPYPASDLFELSFTQNSDIITLTHPDHPARELKRLGATNWTLTDVSFVPSLTVPAAPTVTPTVAVGGHPTAHQYAVTAVGADGVTESLPSGATGASNDLSLSGNYNTITWVGVDGSTRYNVYKQRGGVFGYIGQATPNPVPSVAISTLLRGTVFTKSRTVQVATAAPHGRSSGDNVLISGTGVASLDGYWTITVTGASTFTYETIRAGFNIVSTGTVNTATLSLVDDNVLPDTSQSPPDDVISLNTEPGDYPTTSTYYEQRRWFAGTNDRPQVLWGTRNGTESNLTSSIPVRDADGIEVRVASMQNNQILHLVPLADLIALTGGGEFRIYAESAPSITPTSITIKPQGYSGSSRVQPVVTSISVMYVQAQGSRVREISYGGESANYGYKSIDVSVMAPHRFDGFTIVQLAFARAPEPILWAVRSDGVLLGLTYMPEQQVFGWHAHDTDGFFESICVVAEGNEDVAYAVVRRTVNERTVRYIERLRSRLFVDQEDAFYVDSGLTYDGAPTTTISGLWHLEGREVDILGDGAVFPRQTVYGGAVTFDTAASKVHVGLPMTSDATTLPLAMEGAPAAGQGTVKNVNKVYLRVAQSSVVKAGPTFDRMREYAPRAVSDPYGSPPELRNGELALAIDPSWTQDGSVCVRQDLPLPLTVLSMTLEVATGG